MTGNFKKEIFRNHIPLLTVFTGVFVYSVIYSYITVSKYYAFNATIFDLGVNANLIYSVFHGGISLIPGSPHFVNTGKLIYLVLAPFYYLYPHEQVLLIFQSTWIALAALPLYLISKKRFGEGFVPVAIALSWLLYYPMAGVNWFDFHFMALFPTFFLFGVASLEYGHTKFALFFLSLSAITDFLVPLIMILFSSYLIYSNFMKGNKQGAKLLPYFLIAFSISIIISTNFVYGISYTLQYARNSATLVPAFSAGNAHIGMFFVRIVLPLGFISLASPEYLVLLLPFFGLVSYSGYRPYTDTMFVQYPSLVAPIVFLAAISGLTRLKKIFGMTLKTKRMIRNIVSGILLLNILLALIFTPAGNILSNNLYNNQLGSVITGDPGTYNTIEEISQTNTDVIMNQMIHMIPQGSSVLAQNNMPQLALNHVLYSPFEILNHSNSFKYPQYVLVDPYNQYFIHPVFPGESNNITAMDAFNELLKSGNYGIYAQAEGVTLLENGYVGKPIWFIPLDSNYTISNLRIPSYVVVNRTVNGVFISNFTGGTAWYGPYSTLAPGKYNLTIKLYSPELTLSDTMDFQISEFPLTSQNTTIVFSRMLNYSDFNSHNFYNQTFNFTISQYCTNVEFRAINVNWTSPILLNGIALRESS